MKPYLIQRLRLKKDAPKEPAGFDQLYECDYMGAAEFEYGTLPTSLREITAALDGFEVTKVLPEVLAHDGRRLYTVCHRDYTAEIMALVPDLIADKFRLKEHTGIKAALTGEKSWYNGMDAWWDVQHCWFLVLGEKNAQRTLVALRALRTRWQAEGKIQ
jgi:hypothetical protein